MRGDWVKVGTDVGVGGVAGVGDQLIQNEDDKRAAAAPGGKLAIMKQYGTYYNYGVPLLAVVATAMGWVSGAWATRAVVAGSQLAGRKATKQITKKATPVPYGSWQRDAAAKAAAAARARAGGSATPAGVGLEF